MSFPLSRPCGVLWLVAAAAGCARPVPGPREAVEARAPESTAAVPAAAGHSGGSAAIAASGPAPSPAAPRPKIVVHVIGDSTASSYDPSRAPRTGWAQVLAERFTQDVEVDNAAASGRSSKSFFDEGRWAPVLRRLHAGDYVLIQFGHNDSKPERERHTEPATTFKQYLTRYVVESRERGAAAVLLTPIERRKFEGPRLLATHEGYPEAVRELGRELQAPVIDLTARTRAWLEPLGDAGTRAFFLHLAPGESPNYPEGSSDDTHLSRTGAIAVAGLVADGIRELNLSLTAYLVP